VEHVSASVPALVTELVVKPVREALRRRSSYTMDAPEKAVVIKTSQFVDALCDDDKLRDEYFRCVVQMAMVELGKPDDGR
jgi:hypothetical protein